MSTSEGVYDFDLSVVSCSAHLEGAGRANQETLPAGDYWLSSARYHEQEQSFVFANKQCIKHCQTPPTSLLPVGDVLIYVHGFCDVQLDAMLRGGALQDMLLKRNPDETVQRIQKDAHRKPRRGRTRTVTAALGRRKTLAGTQSVLKTATVLQTQLTAQATLQKGQEHAPATTPSSSVIAFTWPTAHTVWPGYMLDKDEVACFAAFSLANLLRDLRVAEPQRRILLVAHSMGCFLTIKALGLLAALRGVAPQGIVVDQVVFYAADMNSDALQKASPTSPDGYGYQALDQVGRLITYASTHDNILVWEPFVGLLTQETKSVAGAARLGFCGPFNRTQSHDNLIAVDCSSAVYDHGDYFSQPEVLKDTAKRLAEPGPFESQPATRGTPLRGGKRRWGIVTPIEMGLEWWERTFLCSTSRGLRGLGYLLALPLYLIVLLLAAGVLVFLLIFDTVTNGKRNKLPAPRTDAGEAGA